jgi:uncharacterized damage-inducible protein DinB
MADSWMDPADDPRHAAFDQPRGEIAVVRSYLRHYRATLELKCEGLDAEQLARRSVPPSTLSLLGMVRHLASVEHRWFQVVLRGLDEPRLFKTEANDDADFDDAVADPAMVDEAWEAWRREAIRAEDWLDAVQHEPGFLDRIVRVRDDEQVEVRDILVHLVEEYARHLGHVDLLRECIDGRTGQ